MYSSLLGIHSCVQLKSINCVRETKVLQAMQNDETEQHGAFYLFSMCATPTQTTHSHPRPAVPLPLGISFVWQTWKQTQLISYQSNFSAYASNLHAINLCDKVKCRTVDTGWLKGGSMGRTAEVFLVPPLLFCIVRLTVVKWFATWLICSVSFHSPLSLHLVRSFFLHIFQIVGKYDLYALAKFVSVHEHAERSFILMPEARLIVAPIYKSGQTWG